MPTTQSESTSAKVGESVDQKTEEDYIRCPKLGNSLERFIAKSSEGVEDPVIARLLMISEES